MCTLRLCTANFGVLVARWLWLILDRRDAPTPNHESKRAIRDCQVFCVWKLGAKLGAHELRVVALQSTMAHPFAIVIHDYLPHLTHDLKSFSRLEQYCTWFTDDSDSGFGSREMRLDSAPKRSTRAATDMQGRLGWQNTRDCRLRGFVLCRLLSHS